MPAKKRARTPEISQRECAQRLGITAQACGMWCKRPGAPVRWEETRCWCKWPDFARWREQEMIRQAKGEGEPGEKPSMILLSANARSAVASAETAEIELARLRGEVIALADYENSLARILDRLTARLRALPVRLQHLGPEVEEAAEAECERVVVELNAWDEDVIDESPPAVKEAA